MWAAVHGLDSLGPVFTYFKERWAIDPCLSIESRVAAPRPDHPRPDLHDYEGNGEAGRQPARLELEDCGVRSAGC